MQKKKSDILMNQKLQAIDAEDNASRESVNGYMERGNPASNPQKQRVLTNEDNGSHM